MATRVPLLFSRHPTRVVRDGAQYEWKSARYEVDVYSTVHGWGWIVTFLHRGKILVERRAISSGGAAKYFPTCSAACRSVESFVRALAKASANFMGSKS